MKVVGDATCTLAGLTVIVPEPSGACPTEIWGDGVVAESVPPDVDASWAVKVETC